MIETQLKKLAEAIEALTAQIAQWQPTEPKAAVGHDAKLAPAKPPQPEAVMPPAAQKVEGVQYPKTKEYSMDVEADVMRGRVIGAAKMVVDQGKMTADDVKAKIAELGSKKLAGLDGDGLSKLYEWLSK